MTVPAWDSKGILPPVHPQAAGGGSRQRSPYRCSLEELIARFGVNLHRLRLLDSFLDYRAALHLAGLVRGFQWVNGSFVQNVEISELRHPNDIDVVSHFYFPEGETERTFFSKNPNILLPPKVKSAYGVDAYPNILGVEADKGFTEQITYWYSMWSHRRTDNLWKGFVEISLSPDDDAAARGLIYKLILQHGGEGDE